MQSLSKMILRQRIEDYQNGINSITVLAQQYERIYYLQSISNKIYGIKKALILVKNHNLVKRFQDEIINTCTGGKYKPTEEERKENKQIIMDNINVLQQSVATLNNLLFKYIFCNSIVHIKVHRII